MRIAVVNQKGGTGKTTLAYNLSYALAAKGLDIVAIDLDPQAALTSFFFQEEPDPALDSVFEAFVKKEKGPTILDILRTVEILGAKIKLAPSRLALDVVNVSLASVHGRESVLRKILEPLKAELILLDCQPTLSLLTINALVAANGILIPAEASKFSVRCLRTLLEVLEIVKKLNPGLKVIGIVPNRVPLRTMAAKAALEELSSLGLRVFPPIPFTTFFERGAMERKTIFDYDSKTAKAAARALEVVRDEILKEVRP